MNRSRSSSITAVTANGTAVRGALSRTASKTNLRAEESHEPKNLRERVSASVIGVKGSLLKDGPRMEEVENPMARLKLLLVRASPIGGCADIHSPYLFPDRLFPYSAHPQLLHDPDARDD